MNIVTIHATDIPDAWFQCVAAVLESGHKYQVQHGSYEGETRFEFDWITVEICHPYAEPYDAMVPQIPAALGIPNPVEPGYVEQYLPYLMTDKRAATEDYTYGERLISADQIERFINVLRNTPNTNQAVLQVARPEDCALKDPPCLRHIDLRVMDGKLIMFPYFRSWDLWNGFPANLAGIAVLQKYMAEGIGVEVGPMIASSKGLHIYGYAEALARLRCGKAAVRETGE